MIGAIMNTLRSIRSFIRTADAGSLTAAARSVGISPAAVAQNIARLETHLGVRLFNRFRLIELRGSRLRIVVKFLQELLPSAACSADCGDAKTCTASVRIPTRKVAISSYFLKYSL